MRLVRIQDKVLSAVLTGSAESLASTAWLREYLEGGIEAKSLGRSLLMPVSKPPVEVKPRGKAVCNCFNISADTMRQTLATLSPSINAQEALEALQNQTKCGTNCGSCMPEAKQIIAHFLKLKEPA